MRGLRARHPASRHLSKDRFKREDVDRLQRVVEQRPEPEGSGLWTKQDVERLANALTVPQAKRRLAEKARSPQMDKARLAKNVAPAVAIALQDLEMQRRWERNPSRMDFEGVDAPYGTATVGQPSANEAEARERRTTLRRDRKAAKPIKPKDFYIRTALVGEHTFASVNGHPLRIAGFHSLDLFMHEDPFIEGRWSVTEGRTGLTLGIGYTMGEARADAAMKLNAFGLDEVEAMLQRRGGNRISPRYAEPVADTSAAASTEATENPKREGQHDRDIQSAKRRGSEATGAEIPSGKPPEGIQGVEGERRPGGSPESEGEVHEEVRGDPDTVRDIRESSMVLGDQDGDIGDGSGLELQQISPSPLDEGRDFILRRSDPASNVGAAQRFDDNLAAIRLIKQLDDEDRLAKADEQAILARYSGFGDSAFNNAFNRYGRDDVWNRRGEELRELTTGEEYEAIERSRLNAFYTTPEVVDATWNALNRLGVDKIGRPRVLEPSAGSGRFLGLQPTELAARSQRTAVELDSLTGKMLKHLYPNADIYVMGYQQAPIPNDSVDIAISNVPFGDYPVSDPAFRKGRTMMARQIHNYFFAKTLDKLRPGGVLAFITSHSTLDSPRAEPIREALAEQADLIGAIRLPKSAFPDTEVVTDLVFMRKREPGEESGDAAWVKSATLELAVEGPVHTFNKEVNVNQYFIDHPEMVLGQHTTGGSMYSRDEYTVEAPQGQNLEQALNDAIAKLPKNVISEGARPSETDRGSALMTALNVHEGSYVIDENDGLTVKRGGVLVLPALSSVEEQRVKDMLEIRDAAREVLVSQLEEKPIEDVEASHLALGTLYDTFVARHGALNTTANTELMRQDPEGAFLRALERQVEGKWQKMPLFTQRVVRGLGERTASTSIDALAVTLNDTGRLDFDHMGALLARKPDAVRDELAAQGAIFKNPTGDWESADQYLTGNVREKLRDAEAAASANPAFQVNVQALTKIQPADLPPSQIDLQLGTPWIPSEDVNDFVRQLLDARIPFRASYRSAGRSGFFRYVPQTGQWVKDNKIDGAQGKMHSEWGTVRMGAGEIIERLINSKPIEVTDKLPDGGSARNPKETSAAIEKADAIQEAFKEWVWEDPERSERLAHLYNDTFNNIRPRVFDGEHQTFPGMRLQWADQLHNHQKDAIWRIVQDGTALLAHEVGFGKTAVMVAGGMELRRLGLSRKNVYVVPKATHSQFRNQFLDIYPYAKILFPEDKDFTPDRRPEFMARVATGDWDAVIMSDSQFRRISLRPETEAAFIKEELNDLRAAIEAEASESGRSATHKELQKALIRMEERLTTIQAQIGEVADKTMHFEDLGIDQMFVDEADMYKNLRFTTRMGRLKGLPNSDSQRAWDMYQKVRYLQKQGGGRGVVFATGTPVANTIAETWTMMRYLQLPYLEERGLQHFDAWARTFAGTTEGLEQTPTGAYRMTQRFAKFMNVPELSRLWQSTADIRVTSEVPEIVIRQPRLVDEKGRPQRTVISAPPDEYLKDYMGLLAKRADNLRSVDPTEDNMLKISSDARMASLDMRMVDPHAESNPHGKVAKAVSKISEIYRNEAQRKGTQLVFLDMGTPKAVDKVPGEGLSDEGAIEPTAGELQVLRNVYGDIRDRLVAKGVLDDDIAFIHDAKTNEQKRRLFADVNAGKVRVLIGSTGKLGVGVNVQERAAALHHLDAPWRPRDIEQREGRIVRQGNVVYGPTLDSTGKVTDPGRGVQIFNYVTEGSFDAYMWQAIEAKAKAIKSLMRRDITARTIDDIDSLVLSASEAKALASGNPDVMRAVQLKNDVSRLNLVKASHQDAQIRAREELMILPRRIEQYRDVESKIEKDVALAEREKDKKFSFTMGARTLTERPKAGLALQELLTAIPMDATRTIGAFKGFEVRASNSQDGYRLILSSPFTEIEHVTSPVHGKDITATGLVARVENTIGMIPTKLEHTRINLSKSESSLRTYTEQAAKTFTEQERLDRLQAELREVEHKLEGAERQPEMAMAAV